jgi:hypothetical protein
MKNELVDLQVVVVHRTAKAVLVRLDETADKVWLPLSAVELEPEDCTAGIATLTLSARLAEEKEMI